MKWSCGVQTCKSRLRSTLPATLASLARAGFGSPRLFVDGITPLEWIEAGGISPYEVTLRHPAVHCFGNWYMGLLELYLRDPLSDRFALFQDDLIVVKNLRTYLEACRYPETLGYLNLYTAYGNESIIDGKPRGWHLSNQAGRGALALVFDNKAAVMLLQAKHFVERALCRNSLDDGTMAYWKNLDGGIVQSFRNAGGKEWIHNPSLAQHTGAVSSIGNVVWPNSDAKTWPGEVDAAEWIVGK